MVFEQVRAERWQRVVGVVELVGVRLRVRHQRVRVHDNVGERDALVRVQAGVVPAGCGW